MEGRRHFRGDTQSFRARGPLELCASQSIGMMADQCLFLCANQYSTEFMARERESLSLSSHAHITAHVSHSAPLSRSSLFAGGPLLASTHSIRHWKQSNHLDNNGRAFPFERRMKLSPLQTPPPSIISRGQDGQWRARSSGQVRRNGHHLCRAFRPIQSDGSGACIGLAHNDRAPIDWSASSVRAKVNLHFARRHTQTGSSHICWRAWTENKRTSRCSLVNHLARESSAGSAKLWGANSVEF